MKIGRGVSELWRVENRPLPLTWPMAYTTACTTVQAVIDNVNRRMWATTVRHASNNDKVNDVGAPACISSSLQTIKSTLKPLGYFGGWIDAKGKVSWGTEVTQWGSGGEDRIGGLVDEPHQADKYFGNGYKTDILRRKNRKCIHWHTVNHPYWGMVI